MSVQGVIAIIVLAGAAIFALLNQPLLYEPRAIQLPGEDYTLPLIGILVAAAAGAVLLMLLAEAASSRMWRRTNARLAERLAARERELAEIKGRKYDEVSVKINAMQEELSDQIAALGRQIESQPAQTVVRDTATTRP